MQKQMRISPLLSGPALPGAGLFVQPAHRDLLRAGDQTDVPRDRLS